MTGTVEELAEATMKLPERDRASLARAILLSLEDEKEEGVEAAWDIEVARRLREVQEGRAQGRPAEDVFRDIRTRYQ